MEQPQPKFDQWAIVELMGHRKIAGRVTEQVVAGTALLRIDIPEIPAANGEPAQPAFTQFYGARSLYCLTPVEEAVARRYAAYRRERPVAHWELKALPAPPATAEDRTFTCCGGSPEEGHEEGCPEADPSEQEDDREYL